MDWPRARAILLMCFSVLNLGLILLLWLPGAGASGTLLPNSPEHVKEVQERLKAVGAELKAPLPQSQALPLLRVSRADAPLAMLGQLSGHPVVEGEAPAHEPIPGVTTLYAGRAWMAPMITPGGVAIYPIGAQGSAARPPGDLDVNQARSFAQKALAEMGLLPAGARYRRTYQDEARGIAVEFVQQVDGNSPLFSGQVTAYVSTRGVEEVHLFWLHVAGVRGEPKMPIPASQAVLRLTGELEGLVAHEKRSGLVFSRIELGYYSVHSADAKSWDEVPTWRIDLESGASYYVEGFTGRVVQDYLLSQ